MLDFENFIFKKHIFWVFYVKKLTKIKFFIDKAVVF